ncbi:MAG: CBS domain-containing protein [Gammaproteobacteria bacterium]|nr:CBS domain-containing protein [Gammaproteobacteria bacterium]
MSDKKIVRVRDIMKTDFLTIDGIATISEALKKMRDDKSTVLIVNKRHEDDEYGMLMATDISHQVLAKDRAPERVNVYEIMTKPVISVHPDMDIRYCSRLFARHGLLRAPVLDGRKLVGTISSYAAVLEELSETEADQ